MTVEQDKSVTVNRPHKQTWERFESFIEENTDKEANSQAFCGDDGLWIKT